MGIILDLLEYIHVKYKSLLEYIHGNNHRSIKDIMVKSKSLLEYKRGNNPRSIRIYTMSKNGKKHIREKLKKYLNEIRLLKVGTIIAATVVLGRNSRRCHCGARSKQWCAGGIFIAALYLYQLT
jgi:hypothetical protein